MTFSLVAHATITGAAGGTTGSVTTTGADLLVAAISWYNGNPGAPTISDNKSNVWIQIGSADQVSELVGTPGAPGLTDVRLYYCASPTVGTGHTFTVGTTTGNIFASLEVQAWSGAATSHCLDQSTGGTRQAMAIQPGAITPSQNNALLVTAIAPSSDSANATAIDSGFTITDNNSFVGGTNVAGALAYLIQTSAATVNPTWTVSTSTKPGTIVASFVTVATSTGTPPAIDGHATGTQTGGTTI